MRFTLEMLHEQAKQRPAGYVEDVLAVATQPFAGVYELSNEDNKRLREKYRAKTYGLGDAVAAVAEPIARLSDRVFKTKIVGCGGCAGRRAFLNAAIPDLRNPLVH